MKSNRLYDTDNSSSYRVVTPCLTPQPSRVVGRCVRFLLLALTVSALWLTIEDRWGSNFQFPTRYLSDAHYILGMMKLAKEGDLGLFTHITTDSLGAPFRGQLNDFPEAERAIVWLGGQVARLVGIMPAANIILISSCIVAAFSFYAAARLWRVSQLPAWILSIAYAFLPHNQRSLDSLGIIFTGLLPLQFYCLWYIYSAQKISWKSFQLRLTVIIGLISGLLNIYWIFFFMQMYVLALLCRLVRRRQGFMLPLIPFLAACLSAVASLGSFLIYRMSYGENIAALVRSFFDIDFYAIKPIELFIPHWGQDLRFLSGFFSRYYDGGKINVGERWWGIYIGLLPIAGLSFLFFKDIIRLLKNKRAPSLPSLAVCWIISYSSFGGIHAAFSLITNFYNIRSTNRYFVAIATLGFLYFVFVIHRFMRNWSFSARLGALSLITLIAIIDQSYQNYFYPRHDILTNVIKEQVIADRDLARHLEDRLKENAMIYILPALDFPEPLVGRGAYKLGFFIYDPIRPFLYSTKLRYSYGSNKGRQGADWQLDVQELPAGKIAETLESYGFSGILLNRKGYSDRGQQLLAEFSEAGWPMEFEQGVGNEWVFIPLSPSKNPILPTLTPYAISAKN